MMEPPCSTIAGRRFWIKTYGAIRFTSRTLRKSSSGISPASNCPCSSAKLTPCDVRSTMGSLVSGPMWSRVAACPVGELRERAAELAFQASDVGAVADALEPLQHQRRILAVLPDLFDRRLRERNRPTERLRQDLRRLRHRSSVTGDIDLATVQGRGVGECAGAEPADVVHRNHLQLRTWPERRGQGVALKTVGRQKVLHKEHRTQDDVRREAEATHGFLDAPLVVEVRDACLLVRRSNGCVNVVFHTDLARQRRQTFALRFFPLDTGLPRVLHAEDAPRAGQCSAQSRLVIEIALDDVDAIARQRRRLLALGLARQAAQMEPAALQGPRDRAALMACHSGDENRSIVRHTETSLNRGVRPMTTRAVLRSPTPTPVRCRKRRHGRTGSERLLQAFLCAPSRAAVRRPYRAT